MKRIAIVGSGIAGLGTAWLLEKQGHAVTVFEAGARPGGHTHTVDVTLEGVTHPVDTGFLVFNDRTYPHLLQLFAELGVQSVASEMSFSVRLDAAALEWAGTSIATLFAKPRNALRPGYWSMLADILRFASPPHCLRETSSRTWHWAHFSRSRAHADHHRPGGIGPDWRDPGKHCADDARRNGRR